MEWTRSETLALASHSCAQCNGLGMQSGDANTAQPCNCVLRAIFRACYARFRECVVKEKYISRVTLEALQGRDRSGTWSRKDEEYVADFTLISQRSLSALELRIFKYHFLLGADWRLCCNKLKIDRGNFFHSVYRIEQKLGRIYRETEPYALFPLSDYFHGPQKLVTAFYNLSRKVVPIRPPVQKPAIQQPLVSIPRQKIA